MLISLLQEADSELNETQCKTTCGVFGRTRGRLQETLKPATTRALPHTSGGLMVRATDTISREPVVATLEPKWLRTLSHTLSCTP